MQHDGIDRHASWIASADRCTGARVANRYALIGIAHKINNHTPCDFRLRAIASTSRSMAAVSIPTR